MRSAISLALALPLAAAAVLGAAGCQGGLTDPSPLPTAELDEAYFRCHVQPILTKSCSMFACHGTDVRYFRLFARNRQRYGIPDEAHRNAPLNDAERAFNYASARAFVDLSAPDDSLLLRKPLEAASGGYYHGGATFFNQGNVFADQQDSDYLIVQKWVHGEKEKDPSCKEPGSDL
jgi:hypothetical protein